jgi:hypothetical protein
LNLRFIPATLRPDDNDRGVWCRPVKDLTDRVASGLSRMSSRLDEQVSSPRGRHPLIEWHGGSDFWNDRPAALFGGSDRDAMQTLTEPFACDR